MKNLTITAALLLNVAVYAQIPVRMTFSGTGANTSIDLKQPNTVNSEENVSGSGTLGQFTFRNIRTRTTAPQPSTTCQGPYFASEFGSGILRFQDGSQLLVSLMSGGDCIDLTERVGRCVLTLKIIGGFGRFQNATGMLTFSETARGVLADAQGNPVFFSETGEITGSVSLPEDSGSQDR